MSTANSQGVPAEEIPDYLDMQAHCGASGLLFTIIWLACAQYYHIINLLTFKLSDVTLFLGILIFFWLPTYPIPFFARRKLKKTEDEDIDCARNLLRLCSVVCIIAFTLLMWVTGGAASPFVSLFVMTYTLTLSKVKTPKGPQVILSVFLLSFVISSIWLKFDSFFPENVLKSLACSDLNYYSLLIGGVCSLIIPAVSILRLKHKASKKGLQTN